MMYRTSCTVCISWKCLAALLVIKHHYYTCVSLTLKEVICFVIKLEQYYDMRFHYVYSIVNAIYFSYCRTPLEQLVSSSKLGKEVFILNANI